LSTKEAAWELGLSDKTVHAVRGRLQKKLGLRSTAELIRFAIRSGMSS
jgi:DNA-binding NarL/FixJ family response regulator